MFRLLQAARPWIARGYRTPPASRVEPFWAVEPPPRGALRERVFAFCPTYVNARNEESVRVTVGEMVRQTATTTGEAAAIVIVGMQHGPGERGEAVRRLGLLAADAAHAGVAFAAFALECFGKVKSVNVAIDVALQHDAAGILQVDDDIALESDCLAWLVHAFRARGGSGVVGAAKIGISRRSRASAVLRWLKSQTKPACNYPHACCMLYNPRAVALGIPRRYVSDDGYFCFSFLRPDWPDPLALLRIVEDARCLHFVGGPPLQSLRRIRRLLLNHHILMADFPPAVSRYYLRHILFPGFWPVGISQGLRPHRWLLQAAYYAMFMAVGLELALRGLLQRPLREVAWAAFADGAHPATS